jgi:hypothetical protein
MVRLCLLMRFSCIPLVSSRAPLSNPTTLWLKKSVNTDKTKRLSHLACSYWIKWASREQDLYHYPRSSVSGYHATLSQEFSAEKFCKHLLPVTYFPCPKHMPSPLQFYLFEPITDNDMKIMQIINFTVILLRAKLSLPQPYIYVPPTQRE